MKKSIRKSENTSIKMEILQSKICGCSKAVLREKFIAVEPFFKKQEESQTI